jgi:hypothetical protein
MGINLFAADAFAANTQPLKAVDNFQLANWSEHNIKSLLKARGALNVYAKVAEIVEKNLDEMRNHIDWLNDLFDEINQKLGNVKEVRNSISTLAEKIVQLNKLYATCFKELKHEPVSNCSIFINCIKDLKEIQNIIQNLRIVIKSILDTLRSMPKVNKETNNSPDYQKFYTTKIESKLFDVHGAALEEIINKIIERIIIPAESAYNQIEYEERNKGMYTTQSRNGL